MTCLIVFRRTALLVLWLLSASLSFAMDADGEPTLPTGPWTFETGPLSLTLVLEEGGAQGPHFVAQIHQGLEHLENNEALQITLRRLGDREERYLLEATGPGRFESFATVGEPHAFTGELLIPEVSAKALTFEQVEAQTAITPALQKELGVRLATASGQILTPRAEAYGRLRLPPRAERPVQARFPGVIVAAKGQLGTWVEAGTALFTVESNQNLKRYEVRAPSAGALTGALYGVGELVLGGEALATVTDWRVLWAELEAYPDLAAQLTPGLEVTLYDAEDRLVAEGPITRLGSALNAAQALPFYVELANPEGQLRPGQWVRAEVALPSRDAVVAVPRSALQRYRNGEAVYIFADERFEVRPVTLGARDGQWVEIRDGLRPGTRYVADHSFVLKADIEKAGAAHDH
jgi:cobalt-zinc-cadmium efflux system membrane fusion protein